MTKILLSLLIIFPFAISAQIKNKVEIIPQISINELSEKCKEFEIGKIIFFYEPEFPTETQNARTGGTVNILLTIEETGNSGEVLKIQGNRIFQEIALKASQKLKFSPTICDGVPVSVSALITYNFVPQIFPDEYISQINSKNFTDINENSPYFESIKNLSENYKIGFGYSDNKFNENLPLTRGELSHFLRLTLDLLTERARESKKIPGDINLFKSFNPQNLTSVSKFKDIKKKQPFYKSVAILLQTYNIAMVGEDLLFQGEKPLTKNFLIDFWNEIFGKEAVPVNFTKIETGDQIITRGEFALFLNESMQVLSYKVLP